MLWISLTLLRLNREGKSFIFERKGKLRGVEEEHGICTYSGYSRIFPSYFWRFACACSLTENVWSVSR